MAIEAPVFHPLTWWWWWWWRLVIQSDLYYTVTRGFSFSFPFNSILPPRPTCLLLRFNVLLFLFLFLKRKKNQICTIASWTNYLEKEKRERTNFWTWKKRGERERREETSLFFSLLLPVHTWRGFLCWAHGLRQSEERVKSDCASAKFRWEWPRRWRSEKKGMKEIIKREER